MFDLTDIHNAPANAITSAKIEAQRAEVEKYRAQFAEGKREVAQFEHKVTRLTNSLSTAERKARTRRLIERGAIAESFVANAETLTNDEFKAVLTNAFSVER